jgi:hypothetical protein
MLTQERRLFQGSPKKGQEQSAERAGEKFPPIQSSPFLGYALCPMGYASQDFFFFALTGGKRLIYIHT